MWYRCWGCLHWRKNFYLNALTPSFFRANLQWYFGISPLKIAQQNGAILQATYALVGQKEMGQIFLLTARLEKSAYQQNAFCFTNILSIHKNAKCSYSIWQYFLSEKAQSISCAHFQGNQRKPKVIGRNRRKWGQI